MDPNINQTRFLDLLRKCCPEITARSLYKLCDNLIPVVCGIRPAVLLDCLLRDRSVKNLILALNGSNGQDIVGKRLKYVGFTILDQIFIADRTALAVHLATFRPIFINLEMLDNQAVTSQTAIDQALIDQSVAKQSVTYQSEIKTVTKHSVTDQSDTDQRLKKPIADIEQFLDQNNCIGQVQCDIERAIPLAGLICGYPIVYSSNLTPSHALVSITGIRIRAGELCVLQFTIPTGIDDSIGNKIKNMTYLIKTKFSSTIPRFTQLWDQRIKGNITFIIEKFDVDEKFVTL